MSNKKKKNNNVEFLNEALLQNGRAMSEGAKKKRWTTHDLMVNVKPLTTNQETMFHSYFNDNQVVAYGSAGTGKTFLALYLAITDILAKRNQRERIIVVRSAVPTREQGYLPGTLEEKQMHYENPYRDIMAELFGRFSTYDDMKEAGLIEFMTTSFIRGLTWDNCVVIVEEGQNMTWHEINSTMTRVGENTRIIFTGDLIQTDLNKRNNDTTGMADFIKVAQKMDSFDLIKFTTHDIVRGKFVKEWIETCEELGIHD